MAADFYTLPGAPAKTDLDALTLLLLDARHDTAEGLTAREALLPIVAGLIPEVGLLRDTVTAYLEDLEDARNLLACLVDADDCWFDHHGGCQAHGFLSLEPGEKCPHAEAKELLAAVPSSTEEASDSE